MIGRAIRTARLEQHLTAAELANRCGVTENAIRKLESGDSKEPRFSTGIRIAQALGIPIFSLAKKPAKNAALSAGASLPDVLRVVRAHRTLLQAEGVAHASIFGSVADGSSTSCSDVDIVIDPHASIPFTLFNLVGAQLILEKAIGRPVEVVMRRDLLTVAWGQEAIAGAVDAF